MSDKIIPQFRIIVKGSIHSSWSDWFSGMVITYGNEPDGSIITILTGSIRDQAALRGLLTRLWDLNLSVISVQQFYGPEHEGRDRKTTTTIWR